MKKFYVAQNFTQPQAADGGDSLKIWGVAANMLNQQSWTADKGSRPAWGLVERLKTLHRKEIMSYENLKPSSEMEKFFDTTPEKE